MSSKPTIAAFFSLIFLCSIKVCAQQQPNARYPALTLMMEVTDTDPKGRSFPAYSEMGYFSGSGDWRYVRTYPGGLIIETIYRQGKGSFLPDRRNGRLIKIAESCNRPPQPETPKTLRDDPKFARTEILLGYTAYVHRETFKGFVLETYFIPGFGRIPFKRVATYDHGYKRVEESVSITPGEPAESLIKGGDYPVFETGLVWDTRDLTNEIQSKPAPFYPPEAEALGIKGFVSLQMIVDRDGNVIAARTTSIPHPLLDEAALEAAYATHFFPTMKDGHSVITSGTLTYRYNY